MTTVDTRRTEVGGRQLATAFFDGAVAALSVIESMPGVGSPFIGELIEIPGLRRVAIEGFPCGWYYLDRVDGLDVIRLLADRQDLGQLLGEPLGG